MYLNKRKQENESSQKVEPLWLVSHLEARQVTDYPHDSGEWTVVLYERPNGKSPVAEFIEEQPKRNQAKIFAELDDLAEFRPDAQGEQAEIYGQQTLGTALSR